MPESAKTLNEFQQTTDILSQRLESIYKAFIERIPEFILCIIIMFVAVIIARSVRNMSNKIAAKRTDDALANKFFGNILASLIIFAGIITCMYILGWDKAASNLLTGFGLTGVVVGFAFKDIGENFISGLFLAFSRPFQIGDIVESNGLKGAVTNMTLRETFIKTADGREVSIPNGMIMKTPLQNLTSDELLRYDFSVIIDYDNDFEKTLDLIYQTIVSIDNIEEAPNPPSVFIDAFDPAGVKINVFFWLNVQLNALKIKSLAMTKVYAALKQNNVTMPANIIELKNYTSQPENNSVSKG